MTKSNSFFYYGTNKQSNIVFLNIRTCIVNILISKSRFAYHLIYTISHFTHQATVKTVKYLNQKSLTQDSEFKFNSRKIWGETRRGCGGKRGCGVLTGNKCRGQSLPPIDVVATLYPFSLPYK